MYIRELCWRQITVTWVAYNWIAIADWQLEISANLDNEKQEQ